jgi:hypothetical protein
LGKDPAWIPTEAGIALRSPVRDRGADEDQRDGRSPDSPRRR